VSAFDIRSGRGANRGGRSFDKQYHARSRLPALGAQAQAQAQASKRASETVALYV
jgi:hypothetical protein